jgi:4-hydroxy-2-oxoheptanedioate aldolase
VLKLIQKGKLPLTFKVNLGDPRVVEIVGLSGFDAVWLCREHVPNDWINLENQIRAARVHDMDSLVRVERGSYSDYIRPFEAGASGIIVPQVTNAEETRHIVELVRFFPEGKRGLDGGNIDGQFCLIPVEQYVRHANQEQVVILQIESPEALENVEEIAAVPGYNGILFGPGDFSHRLGKVGQINDPAVVAARKRVAAACLEHGKFAMSAGLIAPLPELIAEGYSAFNMGADVLALTGTLRQGLELVNQQIAGLPGTTNAAARRIYA